MKKTKNKKLIYSSSLVVSILSLALLSGGLVQEATANEEKVVEQKAVKSETVKEFVLSDWTYSETDISITLTQYNGNLTSFYVPGQYDGKQIIVKSFSIFPKTMTDLVLEEVNGVKVGLGTTTLATAFYDNKKVVSLDLNGLDVSKVTNMSNTFRGATNLTALEVGEWDTSSVTNMAYLFASTLNLKTLDVSQWDTSSVRDMDSTFRGMSELTTLDVSQWDTSSVREMDYLFSDSEKLTNLDVNDWDVSSVTTMQGLFSGVRKLTTLDLSKWYTPRVENMSYMFSDTTNLTILDMSNWDTSSMTSMSGVFGSGSPLLVVATDEVVKNLRNSSSRDGVELTFNTNDGVFADGTTQFNSEALKVIDSVDYTYLDNLVLDISKAVEIPTHATGRFKGWESLNDDFGTGLEYAYNLLSQTFNATWMKTKDDLSITGTIEPTMISLKVPTEALSFIINPNLTDSVVTPTFELINETSAPLEVRLLNFEQITDIFNDVLPSKYESWDHLNKEQSKDIAVALTTLENDQITNRYYVADIVDSPLIGTLKALSSLTLGFDVLHGKAIASHLDVQYKLTFVFGLID